MSMSMLWSAQYLKMSESIVTPVLENKISIDTDPFVRNTQTDLQTDLPTPALQWTNTGVFLFFPAATWMIIHMISNQQPGDKNFFSCLVLPQRPCVFVERTAPPWMWDTRQPLVLFDSQFLKCVWKRCGNLHLPGSHGLATHCTASATPVSLFCLDLRIATITITIATNTTCQDQFSMNLMIVKERTNRVWVAALLLCKNQTPSWTWKSTRVRMLKQRTTNCIKHLMVKPLGDGELSQLQWRSIILGPIRNWCRGLECRK